VGRRDDVDDGRVLGRGGRWDRGGDSLAGRPDTRAAVGSRVEVLRERYARGEIGKDEFEAKKRDLG